MIAFMRRAIRTFPMENAFTPAAPAPNLLFDLAWLYRWPSN
jgi:hypothetical protein